MSEKLERTETIGGDESSEVESWLRRAAQAPNAEARTPLPQPGQVIAGKYRIEEQLGKGGMGAVYRATHVVSDKQVALKWMLRPASDERAKERFTREARAAGRIDHPNVVDVYDIGQDGDAGYLVMELLRGESLRTRLTQGPLLPTAAVDLLLPAVRGVAAAHREGVIHRDLKPDNIFLCRAPDGAAREAKVLDFGISTLTTLEPDDKTTLTKDGTVLGTPSYMSPEQLESARNADALSDVYAFGVILYEAMTGKLPFVGNSYSALVLTIANTKARAPRELRPEIPVELERVVQQAMAKDRTRRIASMDALVAALVPFASPTSSSWGENPSIELRRTSVSAAARSNKAVLSLVVVLAAGLAWWMLRAPVRDSPPQADAVRQPAPSVLPVVAPVPPSPPAAVVPAKTPTEPSDAPRERAAKPPPSVPRPAHFGAATSRGRRSDESPPETAPEPPLPLPAAAARSGRIKIDDL